VTSSTNTPPNIIKKVGVNFLSGLGAIINAEFAADMGDHGRVHCPVTLRFNKLILKLSYYNPRTGNVIYREENALQ
jgi:hypothetical protein